VGNAWFRERVDAYTWDSQKFVVGKVMEFVFDHLTDLKLLLFHAQGSSLANFKDRVADAFTDLLCEWVESIRPQKVLYGDGRLKLKAGNLYYRIGLRWKSSIK
jgi:hypothetical protein